MCPVPPCPISIARCTPTTSICQIACSTLSWSNVDYWWPVIDEIRVQCVPPSNSPWRVNVIGEVKYCVVQMVGVFRVTRWVSSVWSSTVSNRCHSYNRIARDSPVIIRGSAVIHPWSCTYWFWRGAKLSNKSIVQSHDGVNVSRFSHDNWFKLCFSLVTLSKRSSQDFC